MSKIDFSKFDFSKEQLRDISQMLFDDVLHSPELETFHTIYDKIVTDKDIGWIGEGGLVGQEAQGCKPTPQAWDIATRVKTWSPKRWEVFLEECATDLEKYMTVYNLKHRVEWDDLTDTDYYAIITKILADSIRKMLWRFIWFGDKEAKNVSDGGLITNGVDPKFFNLIDGLWKQIFADVPAGNRVAIPANAETTIADQRKNLTGQMIYDTLDAMYYGADIIARNQPDLAFMCTQSIADGYARYLQGKQLESTYHNIIEGVPALKFNNINLIPIPLWDEFIINYENNGTKLNNPHRVVLLPKSVLGVGFPGSEALENIEVWYDKTPRLNYMRAGDKIDALLLNEKLVTLGM